MIETILNQYVDDYKTIPVSTYKNMREKHFGHLKEDFSFLDGYDTIVVLALSYQVERPKFKGKGYGYISRYAHGKDYHLVFTERLKQIESDLKTEGINAKGSVDISPLDERFAAFLSGMGFLGHNQFLIHPTFGTHLYLATLLIDSPLTIEPYLLDDCAECTKCIDACPVGALSKHHMDINTCMSHITQEKKVLNTYELSKMKTYLFGCDICQNVCPKNKDISPIKKEVFKSDEAAQIHLKTLLDSSNKSLMKQYKNYAFSWRGMSVLKRNALALLHTQNDPELPRYIEKIKNTLQTPWVLDTINTIKKGLNK